MFLLKYVRPEEATGSVQEIYSIFPPGVPVPEPLQLLSASPELLQKQGEMLKYFMGHESFQFGVLAVIRYILAARYNYEYCKLFNGGLLQKAGGMTQEQLDDMVQDPSTAPLEPREVALVQFVVEAVAAPDSVNEEDIARLKAQEWTDSDILDALQHGASIVSMGTIYRALDK